VDLDVDPLVPGDVDAVQPLGHSSVLESSDGTLLWLPFHMKLTDTLCASSLHVPEIDVELEMAGEVSLELQESRQTRARGRKDRPARRISSECS
jgi:hypothetical protein